MTEKYIFENRKKRIIGTKELNESQINQRVKNINLTKRLISYEKYINAISKDKRCTELKNSWHPETPRVNKSISLSQWNKELQKWRKQIHAWNNLPDDVYNYICSLPSIEQNNYLSKLKLPELTNVEINNLKKKNEQISEKVLKDVLLLSNKSSNNKQYPNNEVVIDKPLLFLPQKYSGTILNDEFVIVKQDNLEKLFSLLKNEYNKNNEYLFNKYYQLYFMTNNVNLNNEQKKTNTIDIVISLKKQTQKVTSDNVIYKDHMSEYIKKQKIEASKYLHCFNGKEKNKYHRGRKTF
ncbi:histone RNA hairpin-binding protein, putative [Hepatocystis sp. ex Piliocolobus tephrosceles]|nr:histone RNA hairpin-binding protein, putative [Hepatocystis sp. ex Piliocolobus tephrosceles]